MIQCETCHFFGGGGLEGLEGRGGTGFPERCVEGSGGCLAVVSEGCVLEAERLGLLWWFLGREGRGGTGRGGRSIGGEGDTYSLVSEDEEVLFEGM